jgi:hypothetical protein
MGDECIHNLIGKPETKQATCKIYVGRRINLERSPSNAEVVNE